MMNSYLNSYLTSSVFETFRISANAFCNYLETLDNTKANSFPGDIRVLLLTLYIDAINLPEVDLVIDDDYEDIELSESIKTKAVNIGGIISDILPFKQFYRTTYSPEDLDSEELAHGFLIDDLQDIYVDIKEPLIFVTRNDAAIQQAIWDIKFSLRHHWGDHCISALHYLHFLCKQY